MQSLCMRLRNALNTDVKDCFNKHSRRSPYSDKRLKLLAVR